MASAKYERGARGTPLPCGQRRNLGCRCGPVLSFESRPLGISSKGAVEFIMPLSFHDTFFISLQRASHKARAMLTSTAFPINFFCSACVPIRV